MSTVKFSAFVVELEKGKTVGVKGQLPVRF